MSDPSDAAPARPGAPRRSILARSWRVVSAAPKAYLRPMGRALDVPGIRRSWNSMREVQRRALRSPRTSASGIRLIEKNGRLDAEATRAWMEAHARRQYQAGRVTQDVIAIWETASRAEVVAWAAYEVHRNRAGVYLRTGKAAVCGIAALLSAWLVERPGMAVMSGIVLMMLFVFFVIAGVRAVKNQVYLESLVGKDGG